MKKKTIIILVSITGSVIGLVLVSLIMVVTLSERSVRYLSLDDDEVKFSGNPDEDGVYVKDLKLQSFWNKVSIMITLKPNAQGTLTVPDGRKYVGEFKDGDPHGQGTYTWPDGRKYVGEFRDGLPNGQGTLTIPDGVQYVGEYKDGMPWNGTAYDKDGNVLGTFSNDVLEQR